MAKPLLVLSLLLTELAALFKAANYPNMEVNINA